MKTRRLERVTDTGSPTELFGLARIRTLIAGECFPRLHAQIHIVLDGHICVFPSLSLFCRTEGRARKDFFSWLNCVFCAPVEIPYSAQLCFEFLYFSLPRLRLRQSMLLLWLLLMAKEYAGIHLEKFPGIFHGRFQVPSCPSSIVCYRYWHVVSFWVHQRRHFLSLQKIIHYIVGRKVQFSASGFPFPHLLFCFHQAQFFIFISSCQCSSKSVLRREKDEAPW